MLDMSRLFSSFAVDDIEAARAFYTDILGLDVADGQQPGIIELRVAGHDAITVYPKPDYQPATFTVLNFVVGDLRATIANLRAAGVSMERYDNPEMPQDADGVMSGGGMGIAWFKDPAGNILSVISEDKA
jgi:catechol 2,3-dioxygenase-like lactoylglutathione lyase family enzyme